MGDSIVQHSRAGPISEDSPSPLFPLSPSLSPSLPFISIAHILHRSRTAARQADSESGKESSKAAVTALDDGCDVTGRQAANQGEIVSTEHRVSEFVLIPCVSDL